MKSLKTVIIVAALFSGLQFAAMAADADEPKQTKPGTVSGRDTEQSERDAKPQANDNDCPPCPECPECPPCPECP